MSSKNAKGGSGGFAMFLLGAVFLAFVAQYVSTKPSAPPAASQALTRWVAQDRRQAAIGSQETKEGYVIDPALAQRMLADTAIQVRVTGVRGFSDNVIARATVTAPGAEGRDVSAIRYFALNRASADDWTVTGEVKPRDWYIKLW
jgi:hypothetical protein